MTNEDRQKFLSENIPEFTQATNLTQEEVLMQIGKLNIDKITGEKQIIILLDRLIEATEANNHLRETLSTLQQKSPTPQKT